MTFTTVAGLVALTLFGLMLGMQFFVRLRSKAMTGKPLPVLPGSLGQRVSSTPHALVYFFSPGCAACRPITPRVKALAEKNREVFAVDVMQDMPLAQALGVMATPSTVEVSAGTIIGYHVGPIPPQVLARFGG